MIEVTKDRQLKEYPYLSRYASIPTYYNSFDRKRFYGTARQLRTDNMSYLEHKVLKHETLDIISLKYYNTPLYWWIIADYNRIQDPLDITKLKTIRIPNLRDIRFE